MTAPSQQGSRWGAFLQQAVAGVESRLDNILADGTEESTAAQVSGRGTKLTSPGVPFHQQASSSKSALTSSKANDRLQERLARAVSTKNGGPKGDYTTSSLLSRSSSPASAAEEYRKSFDKESSQSVGAESSNNQESKKITLWEKHDEIEQASASIQPINCETRQITGHTIDLSSSIDQGEKVINEPIESSSLRRIDDMTTHPFGSTDEVNSTSLSMTSAEYEALLKKLQSDIVALEAQRQEESYTFTEKIDALQCKLQYLTKESAERAKLVSDAASSGSLEKKLADKEYQVAQLLEEGLSLSKKELNQLATIKKLKIQLREENKEVNATKKREEALKIEAIHATERLKKMQSYEKQAYDQQQLITQLSHDLKLIQTENKNNLLTITNLKTILDDCIMQDAKIDTDMMHKSVQEEQKRVTELLENIKNLEVEKELEASKAESNIRELKVIIDMNEKRARATELEMKTEQQMLESKLEAMRVRVEEASSGVTGNAQARLLRQIETLQTQYSVATENWQGIEASLVAKILNLEKERDEAIRKEADARRKAREAAQRVQSTEEELEDLRVRISTSQQELSSLKFNCETLEKRAKQAEKQLEDARITFDQEKQALRLDHQNRLAEEKQKWLEEIWTNNNLSFHRPEPSSIIPGRKSLTYEYIGLQNHHNRRSATNSITQESASRPQSFNNSFPSSQAIRKPSGQITSLSHRNSRTSLKEKFIGNESPHLHPDSEELIESSFTSCSSSINSNNNVNITTQELELKSDSTIGAGPSVQLIERMSSAVRRLECEKVAMQEDITRLAAQRDEARSEIIQLMGQVDAKNKIENRVVELEKELHKVKERYEVTLVMLGEKSEEVDELRGDIQDIKSMYRDLVERTVE